MQGTYTPWLVYLSIAVAVVVSYTALKLATRVSRARDFSAAAWLGCGALAMGFGIWAMHFIGMLALRLPIRLTYDVAMTLLSLAIAVVTSGFALVIVSRSTSSVGKLAAAAVVMGTGIATMHYTGMHGIRIVPGISYDPVLLIASVAIAIVASFVALWLAFNLREGGSWQMLLARIAAAAVMGLAISGMHYTGMAASQFAPGSYCTTGAPIDNVWFAITIAVLAFGIMAITLLTIAYNTHAHQVLDTAAFERSGARLRYASSHDVLTGLPNRVAITRAVEQAVLEPHERDAQFAVMVLNVDRLKAINDSLGHQEGDKLLQELATRLRSALRRGDVLARLAGDEFTIMARDIRGQSDAETIVSKLCEAVRAPFSIKSLDIHASLSIGISMYPVDGDCFEALLRRAETAMRCAKASTRGSFRFYSAEMSGVASDRLALESELRRALELGQLELHYQPKVDISTNRIRSAEALVRWRHPQRGLVPPATFIPLAEESGLIVPLGEWVLREACRQVRAWLDSGMSPVRIAVNLSARQFRHAQLIAVVKSALDDSKLQPGYLELEITESAVMDDAEKSAATLQILSTMGVHISIDDFGTGYSSLSHLRSFPLDKLKIDRSFVRELMTNPDDASIVKAIISLAHNLRLRVVAEGVETVEQLNFLRELGCDQYQGFYCSPAVLPDAFEKLLQGWRVGRVEYTEADMLRTQSRLSAFTPEPSL
jgi:diguanylate cyclase (GGDEF)-like protein